MIYYFNKKLGEELKLQLEKGYNITKISRWAYGIFYDYRRDLTSNLQEVLKELSRMEDDPQFEYTEEELRLLAQKLIDGENNPLNQINEMKKQTS